MTKPTSEMIREWKNTYEQYKDKLFPNKKTVTELLDYLDNKYQLTEIFDEKLDFVIKGNAVSNPIFEENPPEKKYVKIQRFLY